MARRRPSSTVDPFSFQPVFRYALPSGGGGKGGGKDKGGKKPGGDVHTTQMVGEEGEGTPPPPGGKTTTAIGEEGPGSVPTTTIARGEEA